MIWLFLTSIFYATPFSLTAESPTTNVSSPDHTLWTQVLMQYVDTQGQVDYSGLKKNMHELDAYLQLLATNPVQANWSRDEKLAYWINAYNAFTVKMILDHFPVKSIMDIEGGKAWDQSWIKLGDKTYSLNQIENEIIRPQFKEPRIHFALNCAAKSCPPLLNQAWLPASLETQLEQRAKAFINNTVFNNIQSGSIQVSKIFEWYQQDFGNLIAFLNKYPNTPIKSYATIGFQEYQWPLNGH